MDSTNKGIILKLHRLFAVNLSILTLVVACGGGGGVGSSNPQTLTNSIDSQCASNTIVALGDKVTVDGFITFDRVPVTGSGLDYSAISKEPARRVTVRACSSAGTYASTSTDESGFYSMEVPVNTELAIAILAEMKQEGSPSWNFRVVDNTNQKSMYAVLGSIANTGNTDSSRIINIPHGSWDGSKYTSPRSAGPFAILDSIYDAVELVLDSTPQVNFPSLTINWSVKNQPVLSGVDASLGNLPSTYFQPFTREIFVLGRDGQNTDEYDRDVIVHEWVHYYISSFSRDDSFGGFHTIRDKLDVRVALSEGLAYALSAIINQKAVSRDVLGYSQSLVSQFSVENNNVHLENSVLTTNKGWFSEDSVINFAFDVMDGGIEPGDYIALGFAGFNEALLDERFINFSGAISIYTLAEVLRLRNPDLSAEINSLLNDQNISGTDAFGAGEINDGGDAGYLPVYQEISVGETVNLCSDRTNGGFNRLGNRRFVRFSVDSNRVYQISASLTLKQSSIEDSDPDFRIYRGGSLLVSANSPANDHEVLDYKMEVGDYWLELYDHSNAISGSSADSNSKFCFDLTIQ